MHNEDQNQRQQHFLENEGKLDGFIAGEKKDEEDGSF